MGTTPRWNKVQLDIRNIRREVERDGYEGTQADALVSLVHSVRSRQNSQDILASLAKGRVSSLEEREAQGGVLTA